MRKVPILSERDRALHTGMRKSGVFTAEAATNLYPIPLCDRRRVQVGDVKSGCTACRDGICAVAIACHIPLPDPAPAKYPSLFQRLTDLFSRLPF